MLQRVQTIYLALAVVLLVLCCCMPLATFEAYDFGRIVPLTMYGHAMLGVRGNVITYHPIVLSVLAIIAALVLIVALAGYKNRRRQMRLCTIATGIMLLWVLAYIALCVHYGRVSSTLHLQVAAASPLVALLLALLARHKIKQDEALVHSADRLR